jgi:hypothetical protein
MSLFTESNPKLEKGEDLGYLSFGLHFAPATISGYQVCASASEGCTIACLYTSGHGRFTRTQESRRGRCFITAARVCNDCVTISNCNRRVTTTAGHFHMAIIGLYYSI